MVRAPGESDAFEPCRLTKVEHQLPRHMQCPSRAPRCMVDCQWDLSRALRARRLVEVGRRTAFRCERRLVVAMGNTAVPQLLPDGATISIRWANWRVAAQRSTIDRPQARGKRQPRERSPDCWSAGRMA